MLNRRSWSVQLQIHASGRRLVECVMCQGLRPRRSLQLLHLTVLGWSVRSVAEAAVLLNRTMPPAPADPASTPCATARRSTRQSAAAEATPESQTDWCVNVADAVAAAGTGWLCHWQAHLSHANQHGAASPAGPASCSAVIGPSASRSGMRSAASTWSTWTPYILILMLATR